MNDRLVDLTRVGQYNYDDVDQLELNDALDNKEFEKSDGGYNNGKLVPDDSLFLKELYQEIQDTKKMIDELNSQVEEIGKISKKMEASVQNEKNISTLKEEIDSLEKYIKQVSNKVKHNLDSMSKKNKILRAEKTRNTAEIRIREVQHACLSEEFMNIMRDFADIQESRKKSQQENMVRLVMVAMGDEMSEEEIREKVHSGEIQVENVFSQRLNVSDGHTIKATYNQVKETKKDLEKLESSMEELYEMFRDMHELLQMQSSLLDSIEHNVERSIAYVEEGTRNLKRARKIQSKARCLVM